MGHEIWYLECYEPVYGRFIKAAARELVRYNLYLACVQDVRWDNGGTVRAGDYNFFTEKETKIIICEQDILYPSE